MFKMDSTMHARRATLTLEVAFVVFILYFLAAPVFSFWLVAPVEKYFPPLDEYSAASRKSDDQESIFNPEKIATQHPMARLLIRSYSTPYFGAVVLVFFLTVACMAPLAEEFVFRSTLQGAFERVLGVDVDSTLTKTNPERLSDEERRSLSRFEKVDARNRRIRIAAAIFIPAVIFAAMHAGVPDNPDSPEKASVLFSSVARSCVSNFLTFVVGVFTLLKIVGIKSRDLGFVKISSLADVARAIRDWTVGVLLFLIGSPIIFGANALATRLIPGAIVAPIPIFLFALYEGCVYYRAKKFAVVLGMHMGLNLFSFITLFSLILNG